MKRPPRNVKDPIFDTRTLALSLLQGCIVLALITTVYVLAPSYGFTESQARALTFATLIFANLALILTNRSWTHTIVEMLRVRNPFLPWVLSLACIFLIAVLYIPFLAGLFQFGVISLLSLLFCAILGFASILWFELAKLILRPRVTAGA